MKSVESSASDRDWAEVCNLSPQELRERIAGVRAEILPQVVKTVRQGAGIAWEFEDTHELRAKLEQLVALERQCCGGLTWELDAAGEAKGLRLSVQGINRGSKLFDFLDAPLTGRSS